MKLATLGPKGTFSHEATVKYDNKAEILFAHTIRDVFEAVSADNADCGIVPVENSIAGSIGQTLDYLTGFELKINAESILKIRHNLAGFGKISKIKTLYLHPQTYEQCELFIKQNLPNAEIILTSSNGKSAEMLSKSRDKENGAIVPKIAADIYYIKILKKNVQDSSFNVTRFFVVGKEDNEKTGCDRTSIAVYPESDKPGLLYNMLGEFANRNINLTKIESRPSKGRLGDYVFYIDFEGHRTEKNVSESLKKLEGFGSVKMLGSYSKKY